MPKHQRWQCSQKRESNGCRESLGHRWHRQDLKTPAARVSPQGSCVGLQRKGCLQSMTLTAVSSWSIAVPSSPIRSASGTTNAYCSIPTRSLRCTFIFAYCSMVHIRIEYFYLHMRSIVRHLLIYLLFRWVVLYTDSGQLACTVDDWLAWWLLL